MGDLACHQELQGILRADVVAEIEQALIDDLGARLSGNVAPQINVEFTRDLEVVGGLRIAHELNRLTPPPPAMAMRGSASANSRLNFMGAR
jgi:hypothetical protein